MKDEAECTTDLQLGFIVLYGALFNLLHGG
jgi:hypothetical protein